MTADEFRVALDKLGYSQVGMARLLGVTDRTARRWAADGVIPRAVEIVLTDMLREGGLTTEISAGIIAGRLGSKFGDKDRIQHVWVKPKFNGSEWLVARHDRATRDFTLPGNTSTFKLEELMLGPVVHPPATGDEEA